MFRFSDRHIEEYETLGYTVFRGIVPPKLIDELRHESDKAAEIVRAQQGADTLRFQPIASFDINQKPFREFGDLPDIRDAIGRIVPPPWQTGDLSVMGVLINPTDNAFAMAWHRDWRDNVPAVDLDDWEASYQKRELFNQVNCALYEDTCTWVVPGSHLRRDTPEEIARFPSRPVPGPNVAGLSQAERERVSLDYCESLPGAHRLLLDAGDYALYRNSLWHLGNYIPYRKRATLHDGIMTPAFYAWRDTALQSAAVRKEQGITFENPNARVLAAA